MIGRVFGRLIVNSRATNNNHGGIRWNCICRCGNHCVIEGSSLRSGATKACGCLRKEMRTTHGLSKLPLYSIWQAMVTRCSNTSGPGAVNYSLRGISVCEEWRSQPHAFMAWALKNGYAKGLQLDRRENDGNYCPDNCRFVTREINGLNQRLIMASNKSGYCGVFKLSDTSYRATVFAKDYPLLRRGRFTTAIAAAIARDIHCIRYEIPTPLNFPELGIHGPL